MGHQLTHDEMTALGLNPYWDYVDAMIDAFLSVYPEVRYSWAHVILDDGNLGDDFIDPALARDNTDNDVNLRLPDDVNYITRAFLQFLRTIPEDKRCPS